MDPIVRYYKSVDWIRHVWVDIEFARSGSVCVFQGANSVTAADLRGSLQRQRLSKSATFITYYPFGNLLMNPLFISSLPLILPSAYSEKSTSVCFLVAHPFSDDMNRLF